MIMLLVGGLLQLAVIVIATFGPGVAVAWGWPVVPSYLGGVIAMFIAVRLKISGNGSIVDSTVNGRQNSIPAYYLPIVIPAMTVVFGLMARSSN